MNTSNNNPRLNIWANIFLGLGTLTLVLLSYLLFQRYNPQNLAFAVSAQEVVNSSQDTYLPIGIQISSIDISLSITQSEMTGNKWEASTKGVSHLKTSVIPGQIGNAVLYGHNWPNILGNLNKTKVGDNITIIYSDNTKKNFQVEYIMEVAPTETSILENSSDARITLYTCSGFLDTKRLVVVAKLIQ